MSSDLNHHGDKLLEIEGHGSDVSSQRMDDLDKECIQLVSKLLVHSESITTVDIGCGRCNQSNNLAQLSDKVKSIAVDAADMSKYAHSDVNFLVSDAISFVENYDLERADIIYSQRMIHYLNYLDAEYLVRSLRSIMKPGAGLFLSASGINSELSDGYVDKEMEISHRFCKLSENMQVKHGIREPVCLYSDQDLIQLVIDSGFSNVNASVSSFGNIKLVAYA